MRRGCALSLLVALLEELSPGSVGSLVVLMENSKRAYTQGYLPELLLPAFLSPRQATADPCFHRISSNTSKYIWLSPASLPWILVHTDFICALQEWSLFLQVLLKPCNQISPAFKVRFLVSSHSLCWIPTLRRLKWGSELSLSWENFFNIMIFCLWVTYPEGIGFIMFAPCLPSCCGFFDFGYGVYAYFWWVPVCSC